MRKWKEELHWIGQILNIHQGDIVEQRSCILIVEIHLKDIRAEVVWIV